MKKVLMAAVSALVVSSLAGAQAPDQQTMQARAKAFTGRDCAKRGIISSYPMTFDVKSSYTLALKHQDKVIKSAVSQTGYQIHGKYLTATQYEEKFNKGGKSYLFVCNLK